MNSIPTWFFTLRLKQFIQNNSQNTHHVSAYVFIFPTQQEVKINDQYTYLPASLMKLPAMITYYREAERNPKVLQQKLTYQANTEQPLHQNITPDKTIASGSVYTVDDLIKRMIIYSDNRSSNLLFDHLSEDALRQTFNAVDIATPNFADINYSISPSDYAKFFIELYNHSYLNKAMSQRALNVLKKTGYTKALVAGVPSNVHVAHKFGERRVSGGEVANQFHECGIVYKPHKPYLLCVMTDGADIFQQAQLVKKISSFVYQNI